MANRADRASALLYAARLLKPSPSRSRRGLLIYPHGRLVDPLESWPVFQPGLESLVRLQQSGCVFPFYIHIRMGKYPLPEVFLRVGKPVTTKNPNLEELQDRLEETRDELVVEMMESGLPKNPVYLQAPKKHFRGQT